MGKVIKKILGDDKSHTKYDSWVIEQNADGKVHFHLKNMHKLGNITTTVT